VCRGSCQADERVYGNHRRPPCPCWLGELFREKLSLPDRSYLAGLWAEDLERGLMWSSDFSRKDTRFGDFLECLDDPKPYITPSWSPLRGLDGSIPSWYFSRPDGGPVWCTHLPNMDCGISVSVQPKTGNIQGELSNGIIEVQGGLFGLVAGAKIDTFGALPGIFALISTLGPLEQSN